MLEYAILGFFIAFAVGLTGVGAGSLTTPFLIILGLDPTKAVSSALVFSSLVKLPGFLIQALYRNVDYRILLRMSFGGIPGVIFGAFFHRALYQREELERFIFLILGLTILSSVLLNTLIHFKDKGVDLSRHSWLLPLLCFFIGAEVGFTSAGAAALGMLLLLSFSNFPPRKAVGVDLGFGLVCSSVGGLFHILQEGKVVSEVSLLMSLGGLVGIWFGIQVGRKINPELLRWIIYSMLLVFSAEMIGRSLAHG